MFVEKDRYRLMAYGCGAVFMTLYLVSVNFLLG